jgi:hypothetical protein
MQRLFRETAQAWGWQLKQAASRQADAERASPERP